MAGAARKMHKKPNNTGIKMARGITIRKHPEGEPIPTAEQQDIMLLEELNRFLGESVQNLYAENIGLRQEIRILEGKLHQIIANPKLALAQECEAHTGTKAKLAQAETEIAQLTKRLKNCTTMARKKAKKAMQQKAGSPKM